MHACHSHIAQRTCAHERLTAHDVTPQKGSTHVPMLLSCSHARVFQVSWFFLRHRLRSSAHCCRDAAAMAAAGSLPQRFAAAATYLTALAGSPMLPTAKEQQRKVLLQAVLEQQPGFSEASRVDAVTALEACALPADMKECLRTALETPDHANEACHAGAPRNSANAVSEQGSRALHNTCTRA